jgi:hypothetical protein
MGRNRVVLLVALGIDNFGFVALGTALAAAAIPCVARYLPRHAVLSQVPVTTTNG